MISSTSETKTFPSPILPVLAEPTMAAIAPSTPAVRENDLDLDLGKKIDFVFAAAIDFGVAFLAAEAFDFAHRHAFDSNLT